MGNMTASLGFTHPDELEFTLATVLQSVINDEDIDFREYILSQKCSMNI